MENVKFTADLELDNDGFITGSVCIPADHAAALEAVYECAVALAEASDKPISEVLTDLMRLHDAHQRSG